MTESIYFSLTDLAWTVLFIVWFIGFFGNKKTQRVPYATDQILVSIILIIGFALLFLGPVPATGNPAIGILGVVLAFGSVAFAIWARVTIGKNWSGAVVTLKEGHELVDTGPYALVRHPIYTGFLGAALGTALTVGSIAAYSGVVLLLVAFLIRIRREEALMTAQFPGRYLVYKSNTRMLVPFVL